MTGLVSGRLRASIPLSAETFELDIETPAAESFRAPGCFVKLRAWPDLPAGGWPFLLDRPFAIHRVRDGRLKLLIRRAGPATRFLTALSPGAPLKITGPLGRPLTGEFPEPGDFYLAAGGVGLAPLALARDWLTAAGREAPLFYGEKTGAAQADRQWLAAWAGDFAAATEDGFGYGRQGLVTDLLAEALARAPRPILACGPLPMLAAASRLAERFGVLIRVWLEAFMACGLGVCLSCGLPLKGGGRLRLCREGPTADGRALDWEALLREALLREAPLREAAPGAAPLEGA